MGLTAACVWRGTLKRKRRKREESRSAIGANNCVYDDIHCDPVYDKINPSDVSVCDLKFPLSSNEAYTSVHFQETNFTSLRGELTNKDAQATSGTGSTLTLLDNNCAYQTAAYLCHNSTNYPDCFVNSESQYCGKHHLVDPSITNSQQLLQECSKNTYISQKQDKLVFPMQRESTSSAKEESCHKFKPEKPESNYDSIRDVTTERLAFT